MTTDPGAVQSSFASHLARIRFHDAGSHNALNPATLAALEDALAAASANADCRVIVLESGHPTDFCRGLDFGFVAACEEDKLPLEVVAEYQRLLSRIHDAPQPVIALIDGEVRAGGMGLTSAADIVIATARSTFTLTETVFGLVPWNVLPYLLRRVSVAKARWMILTAATLDAAAGREAGLVDEVTADADDSEKAVKRLMKQLLRASPAALAATKSFTSHIAGMTLDDACMAANGALTSWFEESENIDVLRQFLQGEAPPWFAKYRP
ncbi:MAG: enoyl-CoA hydratase/isomerase family protein [Planctomycetota bacterium]